MRQNPFYPFLNLNLAKDWFSSDEEQVLDAPVSSHGIRKEVKVLINK